MSEKEEMMQMKKMTVVWMAGLASLLAGAQTWTFTAPRAWSRTEKAATLATRADGALVLLDTKSHQSLSLHRSR